MSVAPHALADDNPSALFISRTHGIGTPPPINIGKMILSIMLAMTTHTRGHMKIERNNDQNFAPLRLSLMRVT